jgi:hypothetical protein
MTSNKFIGCNIFFRFNKVIQKGLYETNIVTKIMPISNLKYIDYNHITNKTSFHFKDCIVKINPENKEYNVIKDIEQQINNGYNFINIKE